MTLEGNINFEGNIAGKTDRILPLQLIMPSDVSSVSAFHVQGNILLGSLALLPSQVILPSGDVIAVRAVAVVRNRYNKTTVALVRV